MPSSWKQAVPSTVAIAARRRVAGAGDVDAGAGRVDRVVVDARGDQRPIVIGQHDRGVLERLALEQAGQQEIAFFPDTQFVVEIAVVETGEQPAGLELDQRGSDQQELGGDVEIHLRHLGEMGEVGVDDLGERHLVQVDLVAKDQVQQQVERTLEHVGLHVDRHERHPTTGLPSNYNRVIQRPLP